MFILGFQKSIREIMSVRSHNAMLVWSPVRSVTANDQCLLWSMNDNLILNL